MLRRGHTLTPFTRKIIHKNLLSDLPKLQGHGSEDYVRTYVRHPPAKLLPPDQTNPACVRVRVRVTWLSLSIYISLIFLLSLSRSLPLTLS